MMSSIVLASLMEQAHKVIATLDKIAVKLADEGIHNQSKLPLLNPQDVEGDLAKPIVSCLPTRLPTDSRCTYNATESQFASILPGNGTILSAHQVFDINPDPNSGLNVVPGVENDVDGTQTREICCKNEVNEEVKLLYAHDVLDEIPLPEFISEMAKTVKFEEKTMVSTEYQVFDECSEPNFCSHQAQMEGVLNWDILENNIEGKISESQFDVPGTKYSGLNFLNMVLVPTMLECESNCNLIGNKTPQLNFTYENVHAEKMAHDGSLGCAHTLVPDIVDNSRGTVLNYKEILSWGGIHASRWGRELLDDIKLLVENIDEGRLKMKSHCPIVTDIGMREKAIRLLMSYNPFWLQIGLFIIFGGESLLPNEISNSEQDIAFLKMVIEKQLFPHTGLARAYAYNKRVDGLCRHGEGNIVTHLLIIFKLDSNHYTQLEGLEPGMFKSKCLCLACVHLGCDRIPYFLLYDYVEYMEAFRKGQYAKHGVVPEIFQSSQVITLVFFFWLTLEDKGDFRGEEDKMDEKYSRERFILVLSWRTECHKGTENQDNYFEEALKMRNLLDEFNKFYGIRKPTILEVRENIFTGSVSSLAWFMSAQETSFVTLGQRVLASPLKVRMHYGHPDVFDRLWFLTRGGISKASKLINLSEDIFAGFNCTLRGENHLRFLDRYCLLEAKKVYQVGLVKSLVHTLNEINFVAPNINGFPLLSVFLMWQEADKLEHNFTMARRVFDPGGYDSEPTMTKRPQVYPYGAKQRKFRRREDYQSYVFDPGGLLVLPNYKSVML